MDPHSLPAPVRRAYARAIPAVLCALGLHASAQAAPPPLVVLPPVVVSASTFAQPLVDALPSVSVLTHADIEASGAQNLSSLLQQVAGVAMSSAGGVGQTGNVFIRGFSGPDVLVLIDGMPMNAQDSTGNAYLGNLLASQIERVEIIRGNVSAIYGSGAIGGVVLITTRRQHGARVSVGAGSHGTESATADAGASIGSVRIDGGFSRYVTQGIVSQDPAASGLPAQSDGYRNNTANLRIREQLAPHQSLGLVAFQSDGQYTYNNATADGRTRQQILGIDADNRLAANWQSHLQLATQSTKDEGSDPSYGSVYGYRTRIDKLGWRNVVRLSGGWIATGGLEAQRQSISSSGTGGIPSESRGADALYVGIDGIVDGNQWQANLRHDKVGGYAGENTFYLGWGRAIGAGFKLVANASTAFNAPPLGYLYYQVPGLYGTLPSPGLRPEKAHSVEAALQWSHGAQYLRASLFQTRATDQWSYVTVDPQQFIGQFRNLASTRTRGLELSAHGSSGAWKWRANLTEQDPVNTSAGATNTALPLVAHTMANAGVARRLLGTLVQADLRYSGPRYSPYPGLLLGSYAVVGLQASRAINRHWSWSLRVDNLLNRSYATNYGYRTMPLGVFFGLSWTPAGS